VRILVVNAGSSTLKLRVLGQDDAVEATAELAADAAAERFIAEIDPVQAVGHRVVHGGSRFRAPVLVDQGVRAELERLVDLAPLHQPPALRGMDSVARALPGVPAVACFDTAFHATLPPPAATYPLPAAWREDYPLRRYGFHGLSHAYAARRAGELVGGGTRVVTAHLGAGASLAAVRDGVCVDTTMGFTPLEGLVMATRSGSVDPGLVLWLVEHAGLTAAQVRDGLEHAAGLAGLAGTPDMREVLRRVDAGDPAARLALAVYLHRLRAGIAAMAAALGGLDVLAFTAGVGERAPAVRAGAADGLGFLGVAVDPAANAAAAGDTDISAGGASARTVVVAAREDLEIVRQVRAVLG
jgi:acetate kinase